MQDFPFEESSPTDDASGHSDEGAGEQAPDDPEEAFPRSGAFAYEERFPDAQSAAGLDLSPRTLPSCLRR